MVRSWKVRVLSWVFWENRLCDGSYYIGSLLGSALGIYTHRVRQGSRVRQREKLSFSVFTAQPQLILQGALRLGWPHRVVLSWSYKDRLL